MNQFVDFIKHDANWDDRMEDVEILSTIYYWKTNRQEVTRALAYSKQGHLHIAMN